MKGVARFDKRGKLVPRYIGPYEVIGKVGNVAYHIALPPSLSAVHNVFHILLLRKYVPNPSHVLKHEDITVQPDLTYEEKPMSIVGQKEKRLRNKIIPLVKVI